MATGTLNTMELADLVLVYNEAVRLANECNTKSVLGITKEERDKYRQDIEKYNKYINKVNELIKSKLDTICG